MSEPSSMPPKSSCLGKLVTLFAFGGVAALGVAVSYIWQTQDLSDLKGVGPSAVGKKSPDLNVVIKNSLNGGYPITITEEDLNLYLRQTLEAKQGGLLEEWVKLKGVAVRLTEDQVEVILEREVFGYASTLSMYVGIEQSINPKGAVVTDIRLGGKPYHESVSHPIRGGRFGKLEVPQGFLKLVLPAFESLGAVYKEEVEDGINAMQRIKIDKGKVLLDPRVDGGGSLDR